MSTPAAELVGIVAVEVTGRGSKSEMLSVVLHPEPGVDAPPVLLRRREATALSAEPELAAYDGQRVRVTGVPGWSTFVVDTIERLDDDEPDDDEPRDPAPVED